MNIGELGSDLGILNSVPHIKRYARFPRAVEQTQDLGIC
jgi:hypothetical protein